MNECVVWLGNATEKKRTKKGPSALEWSVFEKTSFDLREPPAFADEQTLAESFWHAGSDATLRRLGHHEWKIKIRYYLRRMESIFKKPFILFWFSLIRQPNNGLKISDSEIPGSSFEFTKNFWSFFFFLTSLNKKQNKKNKSCGSHKLWNTFQLEFSVQSANCSFQIKFNKIHFQ